ncbi:MAG: hypothetical protein WHV26_00465 [Spirochaetota bacterium]
MKSIQANSKSVMVSIFTIVLACSIGAVWCSKSPQDIIAITGATPKAIAATVPSGSMLTIKGCTDKVYTFDSNALSALVPTYIFTREITPDSHYLGAYRYHGIPIANILDGIKIKKPAGAAFDGPHDIIVQFKSRNGKIAQCSYGELVMSGNMFNYILAYKRQPIQPAHEGSAYTKNLYKEDLKGLRLVIACDSDTSRYLDDVVEINLSVPAYDSSLLPKTKKGMSCSSSAIHCITKDTNTIANFSTLQKQTVSNWIMVGHGRGYKGISTVAGFNMKSFLHKNFTHIPKDAWFLFVGCDGYRCIFSYKEIFEHDTGNKLLVATNINEKQVQGNFMVGSTADYFVDRCVWGLSHILMFTVTSH